MIELYAKISGKVQGVGFRMKAYSLAHAMDIVGSVQNLPDNEVEIIAQGAPEDLKKFLEHVKRFPSPIHVEHIDFKFRPTTGSYKDFFVF